MTAALVPSVSRWPESWRWGICFALALCFHFAGAMALVAKWNESSDLAANAPVIMIDLAPVAAAPEVVPNDMPPDQVAARQEEPEPEPEPPKPTEKVDLPPPEAKAEVALPPPPPKVVEKPKEKKPDKKKIVARAPSAAPQRSDRAAAPLPGASSRDSNAMPNWISDVAAKIGRNKRYPEEARSRGETGLVQVSFRVDRSGGVHNARVVRSSGSSVLDRDALASLERSQPLPSPPRDISDAKLNLDLPLRYTLR